MRLHLGMYPLIGARDDRVALLDVGVDAPVVPSPVTVLAEQANPTRNEELHF